MNTEGDRNYIRICCTVCRKTTFSSDPFETFAQLTTNTLYNSSKNGACFTPAVDFHEIPILTIHDVYGSVYINMYITWDVYYL